MLHFKHRGELEPRLAQLAPGNASEGDASKGDDETDPADGMSVCESDVTSVSNSPSEGTSLSGASTTVREDGTHSSRGSIARESFHRQVTRTDVSIMKALHTDGNELPSSPSLRGINGMLEAITAEGEEVVVFCGIIDILQQWRLYKKTEHSLKSVYYMGSSAGVSVIPPGQYTTRFVEHLLTKFKPDSALRGSPVLHVSAEL